jgi:hypothetical protein
LQGRIPKGLVNEDLKIIRVNFTIKIYFVIKPEPIPLPLDQILMSSYKYLSILIVLLLSLYIN